MAIRMAHISQTGVWNVDLSRRLATLGTVQISFHKTGSRGLGLAFVRGEDLSLEQQCLLAGEAVAAIEATLLRSLSSSALRDCRGWIES